MKILIDPGHGIDTPGKRSPDGLFREYLWNRQVADLILEGLVSAGVDASLVVTETNDVTLRNRVNRINTICNRVGASNVLLVSVHANAAGNGSAWMNASGWSCYTSKGKTRSDQVAECLYDAFEEEFQDRKIRKDMSDGDRDWEENFYVLQKSKCPAVLLENFFYDNREECAWMLQEETKKRIASAAVKGIIKYIKK
jgi:N-acetylmuramoyl-L-alanine amidase